MLPLKKILCPSDFSAASKTALAVAEELAAQSHAELCLVHVVPAMPAEVTNPNFVLEVPEYERALHAEAEQQLKALRDELTADGLVVRTMVGHGDAGNEVVRIAKDEAVDLIVIATHGSTGWERVMFGSVAEKVVRHARRPVLTIPVRSE